MKIQTGLALLFAGGLALAQVPVDDDGRPIGEVLSSDGAGTTEPGARQYSTQPDDRLSVSQLEELVGPVALYPDDLLAIILPAASFPLQIVEAARFLEARKSDDTLEPDDDWDDSVVALVNYPEVIELLNDDLDWTFALGEAVVTQQADVLTAVNGFRDRARAAGNLETDDFQRVEETDEGIIEITPLEDDVIYVPYYEPEKVVVYQTRPVYHYYSRAYPVYYYPYPVHHVHYSPFWGVTTAFNIGWSAFSLNVWHHSHYGHPYYGRYYRDYWWYRRPSIQIFNSRYYYGNDRHYSRRHYRYGDYWRPSRERRWTRSTQRVARSELPYSQRRNAVRRYGDGIVDRRRDSINERRRTASGVSDSSRRLSTDRNTQRLGSRSSNTRAERPESRRVQPSVNQRRTERAVTPQRRASVANSSNSNFRSAESNRERRMQRPTPDTARVQPQRREATRPSVRSQAPAATQRRTVQERPRSTAPQRRIDSTQRRTERSVPVRRSAPAPSQQPRSSAPRRQAPSSQPRRQTQASAPQRSQRNARASRDDRRR